ncbi:MAG: hypothetical protein WCZ90_17325 [Melioribacteraceae bacterium]
MRATNLTSKLTKSLTAVMVIVLLTGSVSAQMGNLDAKRQKKAVENLIVGIQSSNEGVKRDCIYYAALYELTETVNVLVGELKKEKNPKNRILIALALYRIGDEEGIQAVYDAASIETDAKVKRTYNAIVAEYKAAKVFVVNE